MRFCLGLVVVVAACNSYDEYCTGNVAHRCDEDDHGITCHDVDCGANYCVEADAYGKVEAFCALDSKPRASCASSDLAHPCDGSMYLTCELGYATAAKDCAPMFCEPGASDCVARPGVDPTCAAQISLPPYTGYCDGSHNVICDGNYVIRDFDCGAPELCHVAASHYSGCIASATPDPRCPTPAVGTGYSTVCDGTLAVNCFDGYVTRIVDCATTTGDYLCSSCP